MGGTLWSAVIEFIQQHGEVSRRALLARFRQEDPTSLGAVLSDLVHSGLVERTGKGEASDYRIGTVDGPAQLARADMQGAASALLWATVFRHPGLTSRSSRSSSGQDLTPACRR